MIAFRFRHVHPFLLPTFQVIDIGTSRQIPLKPEVNVEIIKPREQFVQDTHNTSPQMTMYAALHNGNHQCKYKMRYCDLFETIETSAIYDRTYALILDTLRHVAPKITAYQTGQYWAGDVMDVLSHVLEPLVHDLMDAKVANLFFVLHQTPGELPKGSIHDPGNGNVIFNLSIPNVWLSGEPRLFYYQVRDNGEHWAGALATTFVHEILHLEQRVRRQGRRTPPANALDDPNEIDAQGLSTALELSRWLGTPQKALSYFTQAGQTEMQRMADSTLVPHFTQYWQTVRPRNPNGWRRYLKAVVRHLQHYADGGSPRDAA